MKQGHLVVAAFALLVTMIDMNRLTHINPSTTDLCSWLTGCFIDYVLTKFARRYKNVQWVLVSIVDLGTLSMALVGWCCCMFVAYMWRFRNQIRGINCLLFGRITSWHPSFVFLKMTFLHPVSCRQGFWHLIWWTYPSVVTAHKSFETMSWWYVWCLT